MTITEADWQALEQSHVYPQTVGRAVRRIHSESHHNLYLAVTQPGRQRMLVLEVDARAIELLNRQITQLPKTAGLTLSLNQVRGSKYELQVVLIDDGLREVFNPLVADIAVVAKEASDTAAALVSAVDRFERWKNMLRALGREGLSEESRRGLVGELVILRNVLLQHLPPIDAVNSWTGPTGTNQDFELPTMAIETKSTASKRLGEVRIASERQLDGTGIPELVLALVALDERRGGSGESLNKIIREIRTLLTNAAVCSQFDQLLVRAGYLSIHSDLYDEPRHTVRDIHFWRVVDDFPRLVEADLRPGVGKCSYQISTTGLDNYLLSSAEVAKMLKGIHE